MAACKLPGDYLLTYLPVDCKTPIWWLPDNCLTTVYIAYGQYEADKAKLLLLALIHLFAREVLLIKKLEIEETKTT